MLNKRTGINAEKKSPLPEEDHDWWPTEDQDVYSRKEGYFGATIIRNKATVSPGTLANFRE